MRIAIINGPNLNLLGTRETDIYGNITLNDIQQQCTKHAQSLNVDIHFTQSNSESELINQVQKAHRNCDGIIINAAGYSHSSISLLDALIADHTPIVEVHLSNIFARESFRHKSLLSPAAHGVICGLGAQGYLFALNSLVTIIQKGQSKKAGN